MLSDFQKNEIKKLSKKNTPQQIASRLKIPQKEVEFFLENKTEKNRWWFYIIIILIPVIFFIVLESALRIFEYGKDLSQWVKVTDKYYLLNPDVAFRYFNNTRSVPSSNQNAFLINKNEKVFRIFILGGSSAAGYPFSPNGSFGNYLKSILTKKYPDKNIEVINLGLTAVNSYTILDLMPGVIEQKPDLVLIYAGHNEYYGALGVGSTESFGSSRTLVNFILYLNRFKTTQLLKDIIKSVTGFFSSEEQVSGTLMSRMAEDQLIEYNSEKFKDGLIQFNENLKEILELAKVSKIPVLLGTLASNLKDQPPFESVDSEKYPAACDVFRAAENEFSKNNFEKADSLYRFAKDLDALRFRASEKLNEIILNLGNQFKYPVVDINKYLSEVSIAGIVGNDLMVDHLHPDLDGYKYIGEFFSREIIDRNYIVSDFHNNLENKSGDFVDNFYFSYLDSTLAKYRILILKNDWPFSEKKSVKYMLKLFNPQNIIDSIALKVIDDRITWERGHRETASYYLKNKDYDKYTYELKVLISQYPFITEYYESAIQNLLNVKEYDNSYDILNLYYKESPNAFNAKWIGIIDISRNNFSHGVKLLEESIKYNSSDAQVFYNLAGGYANLKEYDKALTAINKCLNINSGFPLADNLKRQLESITGKK